MPQPSPTAAPGRRAGSAAGAVLRALAALTVLLVLLAGLPTLLWWATAIVGPDGVRALAHLLSTQDSGQVFLLALAVIGWIGWAMFALSVLMEIPAHLAGRTAPQLKGLLGQRAAATLVGAIFLLLPTGTALATASTPAQAATPVAGARAQAGTSAVGRTTTAPAASERHQAGHRDGVVPYTVRQVRPAESLWSIAEQQLGDGNRWQEIADLNAGRTMIDGATFRADAPIQPGWILHLPADARQHTTPDSEQAEAPHAHTVQAGESLSGIAQHELGDADRWPQIYHLNQGHEQPGGHRLTDPDLIYPHEKLQLPTRAEHHEPAAGTAPARRHDTVPSAGTATGATPPATTDPAPVSHSPSSAPAAGGGSEEVAPTGRPRHVPSTPETSTPPTAAPAAPGTAATPTSTGTPTPAVTSQAGASTGDSATAAHATPTGSRMPLYALGGGLLAAAVLTLLGVRRAHQQRRRGIGRRIPLPTGSAAATELALRATEHPDAPAFIDRALRTAAIHLADAGRLLPKLAAAVYGPEGLELHLAEPAAPVAPFTSEGGELGRWQCPAGTGELLPAGRTDQIEAPYPALVTLGGADDGRTVLVDLEHYPMVVLTGDARRPVLRALALELATSRYAEHLDVTVAGPGACPQLSDLVPEWFTQYDQTADAIQAARDHHNAQARALEALGVAGLRQARLRGDQASSWTPHLVLADDPDTDSVDGLGAVAGLVPRTGTVVITAAGHAPTVPAGTWVVDTAGGQVRLPDVDVAVKLQTLPDDAYTDVTSLLAVADEARPDVPAAPPREPEAVPADFTTPMAAVPGPPPALEAPPAGAAPEPAGTPELVPHDTGSTGLLAGLADFGDLPDDTASTAEPGAAAAELGPEWKAAVPALAEPELPMPRPAQEAGAADPLIRVLGPVDITSVHGTAASKYVRTVTEIAAWMVLHPGLDHHALDEAIWPGRDVDRKTRNPWISRLRALLGSTADGTKYLPAIATTADARYRLAEQVTSDWHQFQDLAAKGTTNSGEQADDLLRAALDLVRGRPFLGVPPRRYVWAEHLAQDMISAIVDVAATLGERRMALADPRGALWAATKGLDVAPEAEHLYRIQFRAHHALGDQAGLERAAGQLERLCDALGSDMEDTTVELLRSLLAATAPLR